MGSTIAKLLDKYEYTFDSDDIALLKSINNRVLISEAEAAWLYCLEGAGVDNWSGYEAAQELFEEQTI